MARGLTDEQRKLRLEMVDMVAQGIRTQTANGYYNQDQTDYLVKHLDRVAKFLALKD